MSSYRTLTPVSHRLAYCTKFLPHEQPVQPGLALTPTMVKQLTERGVAVSTPNIGYLNEPAVSSTDFFVEPQFTRDMDLNTSWELSKMSSKTLIGMNKRDKLKYGE